MTFIRQMFFFRTSFEHNAEKGIFLAPLYKNETFISRKDRLESSCNIVFLSVK